jgi:hypothetical protein
VFQNRLGATNIVLMFGLDRNLDGAADDEQSAIAQAARRRSAYARRLHLPGRRVAMGARLFARKRASETAPDPSQDSRGGSSFGLPNSRSSDAPEF